MAPRKRTTATRQTARRAVAPQPEPDESGVEILDGAHGGAADAAATGPAPAKPPVDRRMVDRNGCRLAAGDTLATPAGYRVSSVSRQPDGDHVAIEPLEGHAGTARWVPTTEVEKAG